MNSKKAKQIRLVTVMLCVPATLLVVWAAFDSADSLSLSSAIAIVVLGTLAALATNLEVEIQSRVGVSGNVMIFTAAILVFHENLIFLGPAVVGALGGLAVVQIREREWHKIGINCSADCLGLLAATGVFWLVANQTHPSLLVLMLATGLSATAYLAVNCALLTIAFAIYTEERYFAMLPKMWVFSLGGYPFALLGLGLGWVYLSFGAAVVPLLVVPILIARTTFASYLELKAGQEQTIETLILALEAKDRYTAGHAQRVATFCEYVGMELHFGQRRMERLRYAALMHDIGKLIVPNQILNKPGRLTESEFQRVQRHEVVSVELLRRIDFLAPVAGDTTTEAANAAVETSGLVEPAIIHVADAFDAMTSTRSYRRALSQETAFEELRKGSGSQFNAMCVEALIKAIEERGEHYGDGHEADEHEWAVAPPKAGTGSAGLGDLVTEEQAAGS